MTKAQANRKKYLKEPTIDEIMGFVNQVGAPVAAFERFFAIPADTVKKVKNGVRTLPAAYWHIFYDKIIPAYSTVMNGVVESETPLLEVGTPYGTDESILTLNEPESPLLTPQTHPRLKNFLKKPD
jgi:hypothetical protein